MQLSLYLIADAKVLRIPCLDRFTAWWEKRPGDSGTVGQSTHVLSLFPHVLGSPALSSGLASQTTPLFIGALPRATSRHLSCFSSEGSVK